MMKMPAAALLALSLAGCSHDTTVYPSLAPRPVEKLGFAEPQRAAPAPAAADPALDTRIAAITTRLGEVVRGFDAALAKAQLAARAPDARKVGGDAWLDAQTALGSLDDWRAQTSALVAGISDLASARAQALAPAYPSLDRLQVAAEAEAARQSEAAGRVQASLPTA